MFPDIYPHASASITPYDGFFIENFLFFSNKNEYQKSDFSPLCYPFSCIRFSYIPTSCTRLLHLTGCSFPYFLHESRQLRIPEFSQSCTPHAKNQVLSVPVLFYNRSQTHALPSDRLPHIVLPGAHRPLNVRRHRAPEIFAFVLPASL